MPIVFDKGRATSIRTVEEEMTQIQQDWKSFSKQEQAFILRMLNAEAEGDENALKAASAIKDAHYVREPVDFFTFINDEYYSGPAGKNMYQKLQDGLHEIFSGRYAEVILSGSIGWGKSFAATFGTLYSIYRITCLRNPQETFGLADGSKLYFALLSLTKDKAIDTLYTDKIRPMLESSPYFNEIGLDCIKEEARIGNGDILVINASVNSSKVLGMNVFGGIMDEVNFGKSAQVEKSSTLNANKKPRTMAEKTHGSIVTRIKSRFMQQGGVPGVLFIVSSKNSDNDFTQKRAMEARNDPTVYIMDYAEWHVKPKEKYSGETFRVFFGGKTMRSKVLEEGEEAPVCQDDMAHVIEVPIEYHADFDRDLETSLRDIAGVQVPAISPFIMQAGAVENLWKGREEDRHPFKTPFWVSGSATKFRWDMLCNKVEVEMSGGITEDRWVPKVNPKAVRHIHIDPSRTGDSTGFCMGHVARYVEVPVRDPDTGELYKESRPLIYIDLIMEVVPPENGEILFSENRRLIYELTSHGFPIQFVSLDGWQSADTIQQLKKQGYRSERISVDEAPCEPYNVLKTALYEERIQCYRYEKLGKELEELQRDEGRQKVDHPPKGSKDLADAVAGVMWSLTNIQTGAPPIMEPRNKQASHHPLENWMDPGEAAGQSSTYQGSEGKVSAQDIPMILKG